MAAKLDLAYMPAATQLRLYRAKQLSPVEVLEAQLARADEVEPKINAFAWKFYDEARAAAKQAEARYMSGEARPLEGVTLAVKDDTDLEGQVTASGSKLFLDYVAPSSHPMVQRFLDAGAIVHAKTTVPEFCISTVTTSHHWGTTRNPWNLEYGPGGSSGGSGAALAAGTATLATGSDSGGSIRIPAGVNGVCGFKAPFGRFPTVVPWTLSPHSVYGPMARTMDDLSLMYDLGNGPASYDHTALRKNKLPEPMPSVAGRRIAYSPDLGFARIDPEVRANTERALRHFETLGARVEEVSMNWTHEKVQDAVYGTLLTGAWRSFFDQVQEMISDPKDVSDQYHALYRKMLSLPKGAAESAAVLAAEMNTELHAIFSSGFDAIVSPTTGLPSIPAATNHATDSVTINNVTVDSMTGWCLTHPFNLLYLYPIVVAQTGRAANNVPTSIQIIGDRYDDDTVFALASAYERVAEPLYTGEAFPDFRSEI
ncbi:MAG: amidase [Parvibaculum sp.]|uniref:amidase n=1 Tax=Parvibaculum sp. TaxID=2024848 RepID=UPI0025FCE5DD|nr:amidase [Parvibaculum sp.]MCE9650078.1 amidase [Parvibaculum sp.]